MNIKQFVKICKMTQAEVKRYAAIKLRETHPDITIGDGFIYAKGTFPVLLVAHMDTVHTKPVRHISYDRKTGKISSPQGIGGDDRCGIYMILNLVKRWNCSVLFCEDEETGGKGAYKFIESNTAETVDVNYIVELDRRGSTDAVFYDCDNQAFTDFVCTEYFKEAWGTFSDISVIAPSLEIAAVNLSSGYYNAHTTNEYVMTHEVDTIIEEVGKMLSRTDDARYQYIQAVHQYPDYSRYYSAYYNDYSRYYTDGVTASTDDADDEEYYEIEYMNEDGRTAYEILEAPSKERAEYDFLVYNSSIPYANIIDVRCYGKGGWR